MHMFCHQGKSPDTYITNLLYMASRQSSWQANYPSIQVFPHPTHARPGACPGTTTRPVVDGRVLASVAAGSTAVWSADRLVCVGEAGSLHVLFCSSSRPDGARDMGQWGILERRQSGAVEPVNRAGFVWGDAVGELGVCWTNFPGSCCPVPIHLCPGLRGRLPANMSRLSIGFRETRVL